MSNYIVDGSDLTDIADAIRAKSGGSSQLAFPAGFVSEIQAIPSGGGDPEYGLVDVLYNQSNITGGVQNNKLVNLTITTASTKMRFMLKKPIHIVAGDVIKFVFTRTSATAPAAGGYNDFYADCVPTLSLTLKTNVGIKKNTPVEAEITIGADYAPRDIIALQMGGRNGTSWTNLNADIHMYLNGTQLF